MTDTELLDGLEAAAKKGACPGVINDDAGHWAVSDTGTQNVPDNPEDRADIWTSFFVAKNEWKATLREAIEDYLKEEWDSPDKEE